MGGPEKFLEALEGWPDRPAAMVAKNSKDGRKPGSNTTVEKSEAQVKMEALQKQLMAGGAEEEASMKELLEMVASMGGAGAFMQALDQLPGKPAGMTRPGQPGAMAPADTTD